MVRRGRLAALLIATQLSSACVPLLTGGPDCVNEYSGVETKAELSDETYVVFGITHERNATTKRTASRTVGWGARLPVARSEVTAIHVHEGQPGTPGRILVTLDPRTAQEGPPPTVIMTNRQPYSGTVSFEELRAILLDGRAYVDVHSGQVPAVNASAQLVVQNPGSTGWHHAYCS